MILTLNLFGLCLVLWEIWRAAVISRSNVIVAITDAVSPKRFEVESPSISKDVQFLLVTRNSTSNALETEVLYMSGNSGFESSKYRKNKELKILCHGFRATIKDRFPLKIAEAFLAQEGDVNVVLVDWGDRASGNYLSAAWSVRTVGILTAEFVSSLLNSDYVSLDQVHLIGFSLGCHAVGIAGSRLGGAVARITGLDPALPLFDIASEAYRLDSTDARFVDVIHTAGGHLWDNGQAFFTPVGHVDFYPNNGRDQPGCEGENFGECSHHRAYMYFEESIRTKTGFYAHKCDSWDHFKAGNCSYKSSPVLMGHLTPNTTRGLYYLQTLPSYPHAWSEPGIKQIERLQGGSSSMESLHPTITSEIKVLHLFVFLATALYVY